MPRSLADRADPAVVAASDCPPSRRAFFFVLNDTFARALVMHQQRLLPGQGKGPGAGFRLDHMSGCALDHLHYFMGVRYPIGIFLGPAGAVPGRYPNEDCQQQGDDKAGCDLATKSWVDWSIGTLPVDKGRYRCAIHRLDGSCKLDCPG